MILVYTIVCAHTKREYRPEMTNNKRTFIQLKPGEFFFFRELLQEKRNRYVKTGQHT